MSQRNKRGRAQRHAFADDDSMESEGHEESQDLSDSDDDFVGPSRRCGGPRGPTCKRGRGVAPAHRSGGQSDALGKLGSEDADSDGGEDADDGGRRRPAHGSSRGRATDVSRGGSSGRGASAMPGSQGGRGRGRGRGRSGQGGASNGGASGSGGGRGGGDGGGRRGGAVIIMGSGSDSDSDVVIISDSDEEDERRGNGGGGGSNTQALRGGRGRSGGGGRGRGRGGGGGDGGAHDYDSKPPPAAVGRGGDGGGGGRRRGADVAQPDDDEGDQAAAACGGGGGGGDGGGIGVQQRRAYVIPTEPLEINGEELTKMRRLIKRYRDEWEAAKEKCDVWGDLSEADKDLLAGCVVRFMLFSARAKPGQPVGRNRLKDAVRAALGSHRHFKKLASVWLPWARHKAISTLGYDIVELVRPRGGADAEPQPAADGAGGVGGGSSDGSQYFVLRTALPTALRCEFVDGIEGTRPEEGFKLAVLALIMQNGGRMHEDELHRYLAMLGFPRDRGQPHPRMGFFDDLVKKLSEQRYLHVERQSQADGSAMHLLMWGEAAHSELTKEQLKATLEPYFQATEQQLEEEGEVEEEEEGTGGVPGPSRGC